VKFAPLLASLPLLFSLALAPTTQPAGLSASDFDFKALLGDPPADGSAAQHAEIQKIVSLQAGITSQDIARCKSEVNMTVFSAFDSVLGPWFNAKELPKTAALMEEVYQQSRSISKPAKEMWRRPRPFLDPRVHTYVKKETNASFPSGHATEATMWGTLLADMFPDQKSALAARARQVGQDRILAGMHYPSDVAAGEKLGAEIARRMLADDHIQAELTDAKSECLAAEARVAVAH
jgi:acid phosphatase (class A)